jgi:hypothetical protein
MGKVRLYALGTVWTLALAIPAAMLALAIAAFLDIYLIEIANAVAALFAADWQAFASTRWPELAGMVIGQLLLMAILLMGGARVLKGDPEVI